jgi:hypothetical protein
MPLAKWLIILGFVLIAAGILLLFSDVKIFMSRLFSLTGYLGKLPGDIHIKRDHFSFYFPITTMLLLSLILHLVFKIFIIMLLLTPPPILLLGGGVEFNY